MVDVVWADAIAINAYSWDTMGMCFLAIASRPRWKLSKIGKYLRRSKWISAILVTLTTWGWNPTLFTMMFHVSTNKYGRNPLGPDVKPSSEPRRQMKRKDRVRRVYIRIPYKQDGPIWMPPKKTYAPNVSCASKVIGTFSLFSRQNVTLMNSHHSP